ncbi:MAG: YidC/Oxa1 family membrane protein insertase [bacterium]|nr:YidC/Oxa1 family membrane protein insertase [bacterium]
MTELYNTFLYEPIFNALIYLYHILPGSDMGIAIIVLTVFIKVLLFWPSLSSLKAQKNLQETQPKVEEIREKYKDDKEELGRQLMAFYKNNKVNPFASCLPLLIQLPILLALYRAFFQGLGVDPETHLLAADQIQHLYGYLANIYTTMPIDTQMFGFLDLSATHNIVLAVLAGIAAFIQGKTMQSKRTEVKSEGAKDENTAAAISKQMTYFLPIITIVFGYQFPAGVTLYWLVSTLFSLGQQLYFFRVKKDWNKDDAKDQPKAID